MLRAVRPRIALLVVLAAAAAAVAPAPSFAAPAGALDHAGRWITDRDGRVVILHGMNMVYKRPPYHPQAVGFGDDDAAFLAREGYNTIRVGIVYAAVEPQPGAYDEAYLDRIRETVDTLGRHGIVSLLDFHQDLFNERFQGEGWPDWAVRDDGLPAVPKAGFPGNYLAMPALSRAFDHFWANDPGPGGVGLQDRYAAAWRHVATRFRDHPGVMGYDLMNEPWPGSAWPTCVNPAGCPAFDATMRRFVDRTVAAIRQVDADTLVFYEPHVLFNNGVPTHLGDIGDAHAGFSFHDYCLTDPAGRVGCDVFDDLVFENAERHAAQTGAALLVTEFGATDDPAVLGAVVRRADRFMVGWQEWHYCGCADPTTAGPGDRQAIVRDPARPPVGDNLKAAKLELLSRPYPQVVAGTPLRFGFDDATKRFALEHTTARAGRRGRFPAGAVTEISVPRRQYPRGYAVDVEGARVLSPARSGVLRLATREGAERVRVVVTPGEGAFPRARVS
nr:cellulase family glycosylhydrolase [Solirubrobacterales bacterium]